MKPFALLLMLIAALVSTTLVLATPGQTEEQQARPEAMLEAARDLFQRYTSLWAAFDPAVVDLYADDAVIRNHRTYPDGRVQERSLPAPVYKNIVAEAMPLARERGDRSEYSDVTYTIEGDGVRVEAQRYSVLKDYTSPLSLLLKPDADGTWYIAEEISHSRAVPPVVPPVAAPDVPTEEDEERAAAECVTLASSVLPFAEQMLKNHGAFYPYAGVLTTAGEIRHVAGWTGEDHPESTEIIEMLKEGLRAGADEYQCTALVYDTMTVPPGKRKKQDAVTVDLEHRDGFSLIIVRPYRLRGQKLTFQEAFTAPGEGTIFGDATQ